MKNLKKITAFLLLLGLLFTSFCGCGPKEETPLAGGMTVEDDLGRTVAVEPPRRVAALLGSFADIWYLAGGEVIACADDAWEDFDLPLREDAVNLGMTKNLSLEKLLAAQPDLVLASCNTQLNLDWMETLEAAGIPTLYFDISDFNDYLRMLKTCTDITGRADLYEQNGLAVQAQIDDVLEKSRARLEGKEPPTVLNLRASATYLRAKNSRDNVLGEMLAALGCRNLADSEASLLENISIEVILQDPPDYIFFVQQGDDKEGIQKAIDAFLQENPALASLDAVKEGRVYVMDKSLYTLKPNDRWGEAYEKLEAILSDEK
ncbi:MAG: ABC transporter substrate-binding protein [Oscillospiraceae bacterium]|nr:ABC transporter substrate-binding protein [Oscillospiraceae bacterium]